VEMLNLLLEASPMNFCHVWAYILKKGVSHEIFSALFLHVWIDLGLYKNLWLFLMFSVEPLILYLCLILDPVNAKT
jgi:hypothetical protein